MVPFRAKGGRGSCSPVIPWAAAGRGNLSGQGSVPLVLEVKSQGQLEVKLDCPALMGPAQGIVEVHVNLEERGEGL